MAILLDQITVGELKIAVLDSAPDSGLGYVAEVGSLAIVKGSPGIYQKSNTGDTDWEGATATTEQIQDAVAALLKDSSTIEFNYNDVANELTPSVVAASLDNSHISPTATIDASKIANGSVSNTEFQYLSTVTSNVQDQLDSKIDESREGQANGIATLDAGGKVPVSQLPNAVMTYEGLWNASTNTPSLVDGTGNAGMVYRVSVAGTQDLGSGSVSYEVGDYVIYNGSIWEKSDGTDAVNSVNGQVGIVVLDTDDISEGTTNKYFTDERAQDAIGAALTDTASVDLSYDDSLNQISATVLPAGVDHDQLQNFVANEHIDHSTVSISAGTGLTGGGDITASRTISMPNVGTAGTYGSASQVPVLTTDAQGRVSGVTNTTISITSSEVSDFVEAAQDAVGGSLTDSATVDFTYNDGANTISASVIQSGIDHGSISGLGDDDHTQYALLAGRAGGQSLNGGTASAENLTLSSTANATKGKILLGEDSAFDEDSNHLGIGTATPESVLDLVEATTRFNIKNTSTSTVGAVTAAVVSVTPASNSVELLKALVTGFNAANNQSVAYERTVRVRNNAGTVTLGTVQSDYTDEGAGLNTANCTFAVNGSAVEVQVTGVSAVTLSWKCVLQRVR